MPVKAKYNQAKTITFTLFEITGVDFVVDATFASGDLVLMSDEGAEANLTNLPVDEGLGYSVTLTAAEMSMARGRIYIIDQTAPKVWLDTSIGIETYDHADAEHFEADDAAEAVWGENINGYTGNTAGKRLRNISGIPQDDGTVNDGAATTTSFITTFTGYPDNHFVHDLLGVEIAPDQWQSKPIISSVGATGQVTLGEALTSAPANGVNLTMVADYKLPLSQVTAPATANSATLITVLANQVALSNNQASILANQVTMLASDTAAVVAHAAILADLVTVLAAQGTAATAHTTMLASDVAAALESTTILANTAATLVNQGTAASAHTTMLASDTAAAANHVSMLANQVLLLAAQAVTDGRFTVSRAEPGQGTPPTTTDIFTQLGYLYKRTINRIDTDGNTEQMYNNAGNAVDQKRTLSELGGVTAKANVVSGP